ncbi:MAG: type II/IV secretion system protein [Planctomycetota bacterium]|nr:MAG: type II/IV secretion system protein [Planctomycetota bacterium]
MLLVRLKSLQIMTLAIVGVPFLALDSVQAEAILPSAWLLAQTAEVERITGFYMNIAIFLPALALFVIWVPTVWWIDDDSFGLGLEKRAAWITASVLTGIIGLLVMLLVPYFSAGLAAMSFAYLVPTLAYVVSRNGQVADVDKVLTLYHFGNIANEFFGKLGAKKKVFNRNKASANAGIPVEFVGIDLNTRKMDMFRVARAKEFELFEEVQGLVYDAVSRRSTDIYLEPSQDQLQVRYRIDGVLVQAEPFDTETGPEIVDIIKTLSGMSVEEKRKPQEGTFSAKVENRTVEARVASAGTKVGEKVAIRLFDKRIMVTKLELLGLTSKEEEKVRASVEKDMGLVLAVGPAGCGKSNTIYSIVRSLDPMIRDIKTLEEVVEQQIDNVVAEEFNPKAGETIVDKFKSILRTDPQVVMLSDFRDDDLAKVALQAASTNRLVLSSCVGTDAVKGIMSLIERGLSRDAIAESLVLIVSQRLVRTLCEGCKEPYQPKPEFLKKYNLPEDTEAFYRPPTEPLPQVCPECSGVGFVGRTGIFEVLEVTDAIREIIANNPTEAALRAAAAQQRMMGLSRNGLRLVLEGRTSIDELMRALK